MITNKIFIFIVLLVLSAITSSSNIFSLSLWKNYDLNRKELSIQHSNLHHSIIFNDRPQKQYKTSYHYTEQSIHIQFTNKQQKLIIIAKGQNIAIQGLQPLQHITISQSLIGDERHQILMFKNNTEVERQVVVGDQKWVCFKVNFDYFVFRGKEDTWGFDFQQEVKSIKQLSTYKLNMFMLSYNINDSYLSLGQKTLSDTISSLCIQNFQQQSYIGLCNNNYQGKRHLPDHKIDLRYSFLIIDRLFQQYSKTSFFLFQQMINFIESKLFYSDGQFVEIPEHINIVRTYLFKIEKKIDEIKEGELRRFNVRIKAILNGFMNQMLLADVNTLEEEINYRENKKMHPTLIKMVSLKWKSKSLKNADSSIYQQSFTPDYFYNSPNHKLDTCISKMAWLAAISLEYGHFIKKFGNKDDLSSVQQPKSLFQVLSNVANNDNHAKSGKYFSITSDDKGTRLYAFQIGYQSLLPYIYGLSSVYPEEVLRNLTTAYGIASLRLDHPKANDKFEFRGNIHLYFNYKILYEMKIKVQYNGITKGRLDISNIIANLRKNINKNWPSGKVFTTWTSQGQGLRNRPNLSLLNLLIMSQNLS